MSETRSTVPAAPGLALVAGLAACGWWLGGLLPAVGASVAGLALGVAVGNLLPALKRWRTAYDFASKPLLQAAIVLLGFGFSLGSVLGAAASSLPLMVSTIVLTLGAAELLGRALGVGKGLRVLIGAGTAICGGSAIAAVSTVLDSRDEDVSYAISVIFLFNLVGVLAFPPLGRLLDLSQQGFGLWAGTAINDTSSVAAAGYVFGSEAGDRAVVVKLARTLMILPLCLWLSWTGRARPRADAEAGSPSGTARALPWRKVLPLFLLGFLAAAAANSLGIVGAPARAFLVASGKSLIVAALAAIGLKTDFRRMAAAGSRPLVLGGLLSLLLACASLGLQLLGLGS